MTSEFSSSSSSTTEIINQSRVRSRSERKMAEEETVVHKTVKRLSEEEIELNGGGVWIKDEILGQGGQATVYLGIPVLPHHPFIAVKSVPLWGDDDLDEHDDDDHLSDLSEECEIFLELKPSPHIIQFLGEYYTVDKEGNTIFDLCFEYAPGGSLYDRIQSSNGGEGGLDEMDVRCYTRSILRGLKHIHDQGLVHCDLKPENILICENNVAKIADFGLAVKRDRLPRNRNSLYRGTYLYVAPEEIHSQSFDPISDIWGLGCIVLEMLTGTDPWGFDPKTTTDRESIVRYIAATEDLPMIPAEISDLAKDFLSNCLVRDTELRWTADMLMVHPFIYSINEDIYINDYLKILRGEEMEIENKKKRKREAEEEEAEELKKMKRCNYGIRKCAERSHPTVCTQQSTFFLLDVIASLMAWSLLLRFFPNARWIRLISVPVILSTASSVQNAGAVGYWTGFMVALLFSFFVYRRYI